MYCTIRMQVGAADVERAKSRAYINTSQKSEVYPTTEVVAYCSRVGSKMDGPSGSGRNSGTESSDEFLHSVYQVHIFQTIFTKNRIGYLSQLYPDAHILPGAVTCQPLFDMCSGAYSHSFPRKVRAVSILIPITSWRNIPPPCLKCEK